LKLVSRASVEGRLRAGQVSARERQDLIARLFQESGCQVHLQKIHKHAANVICELPGDTSATIVVGAHFDFAEEGSGIVDDWSGASLLPSLYQTLKPGHRRHTYQFVAFAEEESGLVGSARYVKELSGEEKSRIQAFVNLECLGLTPPKVWVHRSTPKLVQMLAQTATASHIPLQGVNVERVGDDDTHPFQSKNIPVISIHSVTQETWGILHSKRDNLGAVHPNDYYDAYRLVAFYLAYLDIKLPS
jgi:Zn-dependent M28 family amino/carboxypeptidase